MCVRSQYNYSSANKQFKRQKEREIEERKREAETALRNRIEVDFYYLTKTIYILKRLYRLYTPLKTIFITHVYGQRNCVATHLSRRYGRRQRTGLAVDFLTTVFKLDRNQIASRSVHPNRQLLTGNVMSFILYTVLQYTPTCLHLKSIYLLFIFTKILNYYVYS